MVLTASALGGALLGLGVHTALWPIGLTGLALIAGAGLSASPTRSLWVGWCAGWFYFAVSLRFVLDGYASVEMRGLQPVLGAAALYALMAWPWGPAFRLACALRHRAWGLAVTWSLGELVRSHLFPAIPAMMVGNVWSQTPAIQAVRLVRLEGLTAITIILAVLFADGLRRRAWARCYGSVAAAAALLVGGEGRLVQAGAPSAYSGPLLAVSSVNIPQQSRWDDAELPDYYARLSQEALGAWASGARLLVWPEMATPLYSPEVSTSDAIADALPRDPNQILLHGLMSPAGDRFFNSALFTGVKGRAIARYDKRHLFPFGEFLPFAQTLYDLTGLETIADRTGGLTAGPSPSRPVDLPAIGTKVLPLICYDSLFPIRVDPAQRRGLWIAVLSNDAWWSPLHPNGWGAVVISREARTRGIEAGLPMLRAANMGPSFFLDPLGRELPSAGRNLWSVPSATEDF